MILLSVDIRGTKLHNAKQNYQSIHFAPAIIYMYYLQCKRAFLSDKPGSFNVLLKMNLQNKRWPVSMLQNIVEADKAYNKCNKYSCIR